MGKDYVCPDCKQACNAKMCDSGIGPGEAWGAPFNDSQPYIGSDCCDAELEDAVDEFGEEDRGDHEYDERKDRKLEERDE